MEIQTQLSDTARDKQALAAELSILKVREICYSDLCLSFVSVTLPCVNAGNEVRGEGGVPGWVGGVIGIRLSVGLFVKSFCPGNIFWTANPFGGVFFSSFCFLSFFLPVRNK